MKPLYQFRKADNPAHEEYTGPRIMIRNAFQYVPAGLYQTARGLTRLPITIITSDYVERDGDIIYHF